MLATAPTSCLFDPAAPVPCYTGCTQPVDDAAIRWTATMDGRYHACDHRGNRWNGSWRNGVSSIARLIREAIQNDF